MKGRAELVEKDHPKLSLRAQCKLLGMTRSTLDYKPVPESDEDLRIMRIMDETYLIDPCIGPRRLVKLLEREHGIIANRKRIRRLRRKMSLETIWCRPHTSIPEETHRKHPYLLRNLAVTRPDQVWCADITYVPMPHGHAYLCVVMDWYSRKVLGWRVSNTMDAALCQDALAAAVAQSTRLPDIFNTDQGSQFTSEDLDRQAGGAHLPISHCAFRRASSARQRAAKRNRFARRRALKRYLGKTGKPCNSMPSLNPTVGLIN